MIKILEKVLEDDKRNKQLFQRKLDLLKDKKQKALEHRRTTINRKRRRHDAQIPS